MALWTAADALAATGGQGPDDWKCSGISIDTRTLEPGDLFVALSDTRDGHDFVGQALELGAAAALVSRIPEGLAIDAPLLVVPARRSWPRRPGPHPRQSGGRHRVCRQNLDQRDAARGFGRAGARSCRRGQLQ